MEMRNVNIDELLEAINVKPDRETVMAGLQVSFARIRDAFSAVDEEDGDAVFVLEFVDKILEPGLAVFVQEWYNVSDPVRAAVGDLASELGKAHAAISDLTDVRLRAQGRYYDLEDPMSSVEKDNDREPEDPAA